MEPEIPRLSPIGEVIHTALTEAGYTTREAARQANIPATTLHRHLRDGNFRADQIKALARLIGTRAGVLVSRADELEVAA